MSGLEYEALMIRRSLVQDLHLLNIEGLAAIVAPTPDMREASLHAAREEREKWSAPPVKPPPRERYVTIEELSSTLSRRPLRRRG